MVTVHFIFLNTFFYYISAEKVNTDNLIALVQIFRHGERSPLFIYSNDPHKSYWRDTGELTNKGRRELYSLGQFTRNRYSDWIPREYNGKFIYVETTSLARTHMSAQSFLYGLFPAIGGQKWLPTSDWQPIPVYPANPNFYWGSDCPCPAYNYIYENIKDFKIIDEQNLKLYNYLSKHTGENITDFCEAKKVWDCLMIEKRFGLDLPEWSKSVYPNPLNSVAAMYFKSWGYSKQLKRLFVGLPLNTWLEYFHNMANNNSTLPKFKVVSAHDNNIATILNTFGAYDLPYILQFSCTIWLELRNNNNTHYINVWFKNGEDLHQIRIKGCEFDCPLVRVKTLLNDILIIMESWMQECNINKTDIKKEGLYHCE